MQKKNPYARKTLATLDDKILVKHLTQENSRFNSEDAESLRLPTKLRLRFEQQLGESANIKDNDSRFNYYFDKSLKSYDRIIGKAMKSVFTQPEARKWFEGKGIDIITWHYKTRHPIDDDDIDGGWLSGQVVFKQGLKKYQELNPFPGVKSPYIGIYGGESDREARGVGGPIRIILPKEIDGANTLEAAALYVPPVVVDILKFKEYPLSESEEKLLTQIIKKAAPQFILQLTDWMQKIRGKPTPESDSLDYLLASLKVTLKLLGKYNFELPRSTFLCPAYVADEEVGGMAFACSGIFDKWTSYLGEDISNTLLTYLRLREDALAHHTAEEKEKIDQARRFLVNRFVHDFRHPVESLQSAVKEAKAALTSIEKQLGHVNRVMNETILAFEGRSPNELLRAKKRPDSVSEFFADIRFFFKRRFEESQKSLMFCPNPLPAGWTFDIDRGMFHEVIENLLANALEHGGQHVKVSVEKHPEKYEIHVKDDGAGIPARNRERVFKALYRRPTVVKEGRIRGRGLIISKLLVEAQGGTLQLIPGDDRWKTHFVVEIPINGSQGANS